MDNMNEVKYFNGFGEDVIIYRQEDCTYSNAVGKWFLNDHDETVPQAIKVFELNKVLMAYYVSTQLEKLNWGVPVLPCNICVGMDELPDGYDKYIVTKAFKGATRDIGFRCDKLVVPTNKVYNKHFKCVGYLSLLAYK